MAYNGNATDNSVVISGGTVTGSVYGGCADNNATGNSVNISGGTVRDVYGGWATVGNATGNSVSISGGTVSRVYGGEARNGDATDNSVVISGGTVRGNVYGGFVDVSEGGIVKGNASNNTITLSAAADVSQAALYGGYVFGGGDAVSDNRLIIDGWSGEVGSLNNFNGTDGGIEVQALAGGLDLAAGKTTDFVFTENGINNCDNFKEAENIQAGVALTVSGEIVDNNGNLAIKATSVRTSDQTAITTESRAAAAAFVNQGAETVADSINSLQGAEAGVSAFATVSGNNSKYDTGSYVDINGWNGIVGVAKTKDLNAGKFSYGAFFENGSGNYNTYNEFNGASFRGDGNVVYNGGGVLMRYEQESGVYTEASLRAGTAKNEVSNVLSDIYITTYTATRRKTPTTALISASVKSLSWTTARRGTFTANTSIPTTRATASRLRATYSTLTPWTATSCASARVSASSRAQSLPATTAWPGNMNSAATQAALPTTTLCTPRPWRAAR